MDDVSINAGNISVESQPLGARLINTLRVYGIETLADLAELSERQLKTMPNIGSRSVSLLSEVLKRHGMKLSAPNQARPPRLTLGDLKAILDFQIARLYTITGRLDAIEQHLQDIRKRLL